GGCCRPASGGSCTNTLTSSTCPSPNIFYPGQQCSAIPECQTPSSPAAASGCCVASITGVCTDGQTASTCPAPNALNLGKNCSQVPNCPQPASSTTTSTAPTSA